MEYDVKNGEENVDRKFNPHDVDKLYNNIVENIKVKRIEKAQRAVSKILMISLYASLLAILFASCRMIYLSYGFGPALIFFALPVIINQNKFPQYEIFLESDIIRFIHYGYHLRNVFIIHKNH